MAEVLQKKPRGRPVTPGKARKVSKLMLNTWQALIQNEGRVKCPLKQCGRVFLSVAGIGAHFPYCSGLSGTCSELECGICHTMLADEPSLVSHTQLVHTARDKQLLYNDDNHSSIGIKKEQVDSGDVAENLAHREPGKGKRGRLHNRHKLFDDQAEIFDVSQRPELGKRSVGRPRREIIRRRDGDRESSSPLSSDMSDAESDHINDDVDYGRPLKRRSSSKLNKTSRTFTRKNVGKKSEMSPSTPVPGEHLRELLSIDQDENQADEASFEQEVSESISSELLTSWMDELNKSGSCVCPICKVIRKKTESMIKHYVKCYKENLIVKHCPVCGELCTTSAVLNRHIMTSHNGFTEPMRDDDSPEMKAQQLAVLKRVIKMIGKVRCLRETCGKYFSTAGGYMYHFKICGKEAVFVSCEICGKKLREGSMSCHMLTHQKKQEEEKIMDVDPPVDEVTNLSQERNRRQSAQKARKKVKKIAADIYEEKNVQKQEKTQQCETNKLFKSPEFPAASAEKIREWKDSLMKFGSITCEYEGCNDKFIDWKQYRSHWWRCQKSPRPVENYVCLMCSKEYATKAGVTYHVTSNHSPNDLDCASASSKNEVDVQSWTDDEYSGESDFGSHHKSKGNKKSRKPPGRGHPFKPADWFIKHTAEYHKQHYRSKLFPEWMPTKKCFEPVPTNQIESYLPEESESPWIQFKSGEEDAPQRPFRMPVFQAEVDAVSGSVMMYAGGPIWGAAWCPIPYDISRCQYIAVSCHRSYDEKHSLMQASDGKGLIQIWGTGHIEKDLSRHEVALELAIAHDWGGIVHLEWCPSGCYDVFENGTTESYPRLGLLAAACTDGKIRIISIPHPRCLSADFPDAQLFKSLSHIALGQNKSRVLLHTPSPCLCMQWLPGFQHDKVAVGYSDGRIALFNLNTDSPLLKVTEEDAQITLYPYQTFLAVTGCVRSLAWCPATGQHLAVASDDRDLKIWDLQNTAYPLLALPKQGLLTCCAWMLHYGGVFFGQDDCYNFEHNNVWYADNGYLTSLTQPMTSHNACIWDVSVSWWLNTILCSDSAGQVVGVVLPDMVNISKCYKKIIHRRFNVCSVSVCKVKQAARSTSEQENIPSNVSQQDNLVDELNQEVNMASKKKKSKRKSCAAKSEAKKFEDLPQTYSQFKENWCLVFEEMELEKRIESSKKLKLHSTMPQSPPHGIPMNAIHRASLNPNLGCHGWALIAGYSGLVQLLRMPSLETFGKAFLKQMRG